MAAVGHVQPCAMLAMTWCTQAAPASFVTAEQGRPGEPRAGRLGLQCRLGLPTQLARLSQSSCQHDSCCVTWLAGLCATKGQAASHRGPPAAHTDSCSIKLEGLIAGADCIMVRSGGRVTALQALLKPTCHQQPYSRHQLHPSARHARHVSTAVSLTHVRSHRLSLPAGVSPASACSQSPSQKTQLNYHQKPLGRAHLQVTLHFCLPQPQGGKVNVLLTLIASILQRAQC